MDIFIDTLTQLSIIQFNDNVNNRVRIDLENKINNMCHDMNILRKSNDLLLLTNKANLVTYDALLERYNKKICPAKN